MAKNEHKEVVIDGTACIEFKCDGKNQVWVLVDKITWDKYLHQYHWTAIKKGNYITVKTSNKKHSLKLTKIIAEQEYSEIDYWGNTIDHINNNPLDNRLKNLRIYNSKLNATNIKSKFKTDNNHLIHEQPGGKYKVHTNIFDETLYRHFQTLDEARKYRDEHVIPYIENKIEEMKKKTRDIEFERGLRDKLKNSEMDEVLTILRKYGVVV
jgi:hypothetical protein